MYLQQQQRMITLFLRKTNGKGEKLQVLPKTTIQDLLADIRRVLHYQSSDAKSSIQYFHRGTALSASSQQPIQDVGIATNSIIHILYPSQSGEEQSQVQGECRRVRMIIKNKLFEYDISGESRVQDLKQQVCQDLEIKEEDLTLSYLGVELEDAKTVKQHGLASGVLVSASVSSDIVSPKFAQTHSVSKQSYSQDSQGIPKIIRKGNSPLKKIKKAESMNVPATVDLKAKNINFCSVRLNKIEEKNDDESKIDSQINQSQEDSEMEEETPLPVQWEKPKLTLDLLTKPWYGDQKVIQTESIVGDQEFDEIFTECFAEFTRIDKKRQYVFQCGISHTFEDAQLAIAKLQKLDPSNIRLILNFDEVSKSGISSRSSKGIQKSPRSSESIKKQRSSHEGGRLSVHVRNDGMKTKIVEKAGRMKSRMISIEYESIRQI